MDEEYRPTELVLLVDASGSMDGVIADVARAMEAFVDEQSQIVGPANLTLCYFDDNVHVCLCREPIISAKIPPYNTNGNTSLYDAIGLTIGYLLDSGVGSKNQDHVIMCIISDGEDTSSNQWMDDDEAQHHNATPISSLGLVIEDLGWTRLWVHMGPSNSIKKCQVAASCLNMPLSIQRDVHGATAAMRKFALDARSSPRAASQDEEDEDE